MVSTFSWCWSSVLGIIEGARQSPARLQHSVMNLINQKVLGTVIRMSLLLEKKTIPLLYLGVVWEWENHENITSQRIVKGLSSLNKIVERSVSS